MLKTSENSAALSSASDLANSETETTEIAHRNGQNVAEKAPSRRITATRLPAAPGGYETAAESPPILAVFCYEDPDSPIGQIVAQTAVALAKRQTVVHLFSRRDFELDAVGVFCNALGDCKAVSDGDGEAQSEHLIAQVNEFASRACNAFLKT